MDSLGLGGLLFLAIGTSIAVCIIIVIMLWLLKKLRDWMEMRPRKGGRTTSPSESIAKPDSSKKAANDAELRRTQKDLRKLQKDHDELFERVKDLQKEVDVLKRQRIGGEMPGNVGAPAPAPEPYKSLYVPQKPKPTRS